MYKILFLLFSFFSLSAYAQDTARADAKLKTATVYFGYGAELTHETKVTVGPSIRQIVIGELSTSIDENSLQISVPDNVALLSHSYSIVYSEEKGIGNPAVKKYQDSIVVFNTEIRRIRNLISIEELTLDRTGKLIETVIGTSGNKTVTADETLKLIAAYTAKIEKAKMNIFNYQERQADINQKLNVLQNTINGIPSLPVKAARSYGQLVLQVLCRNSGEIPVSFSYFTRNAGWTPLYDVRVNAKTNEVKLVYKASLTQSTGIDWKQARLTLSTSNPNLDGVVPLLNAWYLKIYVPALYNNIQNTLQGKAVNSIPSTYDNILEDVVVSGYGAKRKDLTGSMTIDPATIGRYTTLRESQLNTNFEIDLPYDIESDGQIHSVTIKEEKINALLKNYAVPKLDVDAYLLAEVSDWQTLNLLPGTANIIMDDTYVGKSFIDPNSTADTLNLSLGRDRRVAVKRSIVKDFSATKTNGNTTRQTFTYEITVKNNKLTTVNMVLKDQFPLSNTKDVEVKLEDNGNAGVNDELGILTWKLTLKPGESKKVRFTYSVKYPKDKKLENL